MNRRTFAARTVIASVALTALGLSAAMPASAHTNNMYMYFPYVTALDGASFATVSKTDGVFSVLPNGAQTAESQGIEVAGEKGSAIFYDEGLFVAAWNHTTGDLGPLISAYVPADGEIEYDLDQFFGLDTLNDGRTVTVAEYDYFGNGDTFAISAVDTGTGVITPLVDITSIIEVEDEQAYEIGGLATDPATGITYVFLANEAGEPFFLAVDVAGNSFGAPTLLQGDGFSRGLIYGADFDADGSLYFIYADDSDTGDFELSKLGAPPAG